MAASKARAPHKEALRKQAGTPRKKTQDGPELELLEKFYADMLLIRRFEERAGALYGMGLIGGFCHLYIGQEAVVVGLEHARGGKDSVITGYRDHGHMLSAGMDPDGVMAELCGRVDGYSRGKGGSMHMFSTARNFYGGHGIVGAQVPLGAGLALSHLYKGDSGVCLTYLGDGAANQGQVFEAMNMAKLWNLPVLFVIENNRYAMGTSIERSTAGVDLSQRGAPFGIEGIRVDGMDVVAMYEAGREVLGKIRAGNGPMVMEALTYRYRGHSMSDPAGYRTRDEVEDIRAKRDPLLLCEKRLRAQDGFALERLAALDKQVKNRVKKAASFAQKSPLPYDEALYEDILVDKA